MDSTAGRASLIMKLQLRRILATLLLVTFSTGVGCTGSIREPIDMDPVWEEIPFNKLVESGEELKGEQIRLYIITGPDDRTGTNTVEVERVDSTFVYGWVKSSSYSPRTLIKVRLDKVIRAEIYEAFGTPSGSGWVVAPVVVAVSAVVALALLYWYFKSGAWAKSR